MMGYANNRMKIARTLALLSILWVAFGAQAVHPYFQCEQQRPKDHHASDCSAEPTALHACSEADSSIAHGGQVHGAGECLICKFLKNSQVKNSRSQFVLATADHMPEFDRATKIGVLPEKAFLVLLIPRAPPATNSL